MDYTLKKLIEIEDLIEDLKVYRLFTDQHLIDIMVRALMTVHTHIELGEPVVKRDKTYKNLKVVEAYYNIVVGSREDYSFETFERVSLREVEHFVYYLRHELRALYNRSD